MYSHECEGINLQGLTCGKMIRSRVPHLLCRSCYFRTYGKRRPISSREIKHGIHRRCRARRKSMTFKKVAAPKKQNKNRQAE